MSTFLDGLFGHAPVKQEGTVVHDDMYDAIANNYRASLGQSMANMQNRLSVGSSLNQMNAIGQQNSALRPAPEPKDVPALAISLDAAYDLWAAKYGYEWVNININITRTVPTVGAFKPGYADPRGIFGGLNVQVSPATPTGTYTVTIDTEQPEPEPEFDWYTVARRLTHVRALENEGGYYRLVPREWCK